MWDLNNNEGQQSEGIQSPDAVNTWHRLWTVIYMETKQYVKDTKEQE